MNRAHQTALFHTTNQGLLHIRQLELNYYINLNIAFGTQAALIGGFSFALLTQSQFNTDLPPYALILQEVGWVSCACTIATSVHVILATMLMQVLGPGLALHGPIGSMTRATQGLRIERKSVIGAFIIMMVTFSISTVLSFFSVMTIQASIISTILFVIAARYWYYYCERIYLRFHWKIGEEVDREGGLHPEDDYYEVDPTEPQVPSHLKGAESSRLEKDLNTHPERLNQRTASRAVSGATPSRMSSRGSFSQPKVSTRQRSILQRLFPKRLPGSAKTKRSDSSGESYSKGKGILTESLLRDQRLANQQLSSHEDSPVISVPPIVTSAPNISMEGYLLKKAFAQTTSNTTVWNILNMDRKEWQRFYFVMYINGQLFFYTSRQDFRNRPKKPVHRRALNVSDVRVDVCTIVGKGGGSGHSSRSVSTAREALADSRHSEKDAFAAIHAQNVNGKQARRSASESQLPLDTERACFQLILTPREEGDEFFGTEATASVMDETATAVNTVVSHAHSDMPTPHPAEDRRDPWVLRADTEEELEMWLAALRIVSPNSFN